METVAQTNNETLLDGLRKNWMLILFVGGAIMQWTTTSTRLNSIETAQAEVKETIVKNTNDINKITTDFGGAIIEIKANYLFIKEKLEKLDNKD